MAHDASQLKKNRDLDVNAVEDEKEKKRKNRKRSREQKKKGAVLLFASTSRSCFLASGGPLGVHNPTPTSKSVSLINPPLLMRTSKPLPFLLRLPPPLTV
ncbi:hypothetical protein AAFF_G00135890 [Aldrovandia affinis]|uniref:Uncharacterized protein n=1 Tax=Aldrovandia affinis TaxID=143900 RepID=A0AAD7RQC4_9TELE|nr:hypothetical protein AAFF_G00135890 [Aldrovandia affinis]